MKQLRKMTLHRHAFLAALLAAPLLLAGCAHKEAFQLQNITGIMPPLEFTLTGTDGRTVQAADFHGKVALLYFGYTHCPDVCPLTMAMLAQAFKKLGPAAKGVRVLFVSVDPKRDTPEALKEYVSAFGPQFVGLSGTQNELKALSKRYRVAYSLGEPDSDGNYAVAHSSGVFAFDTNGRARFLGSEQDGVNKFVHDLRVVLNEG